jgi:phosphate transport system substrate-binding protein
LTGAGIASAQDSTPITVIGSGIVNPVLEALATASDTSITLSASVTGTNGGFDQFCQGQADITTATRTITPDEDTRCTQNNVKYTELLIGHDIVAFIAKPDAAYTSCLTAANVSAIFSPSAQGQTTNWQQVGAENPNIPLTVFVPQNNLPAFSVVDNLVPGDGIRADATSEADDNATITAVMADAGAIGVVSLKSATAAGSQIKILELNTNDAAGCTLPSTDNLESHAYAAGDNLLMYVNKASLEKPGLKDMLTFASSDQAASVIDGLGFVPPSATAYTKNQTSIEGTGDTRPFSSATTSFQIPADVSGPVAIAGASSGHAYLSNAATSFQAVYTQVTVEVMTEGQPAGVRKLCNGEIDIAVTDSDLTGEQNQNCDANNIQTLPIDLGKQAVILVANANSTDLACLTSDQLKKIWEAGSSQTVTNWNQVESSFADQAMTLFAPNNGDSSTDLLMIKAAGTDVPSRDDTQFNDDPLYRAAATANVPGGLTYMTWDDYQKVLANNQEHIQLVSVNSGNGCVTPGDATIGDGSYPLMRSTMLLVNTRSLTKPPVQSYLWYLASDENYNLLEGAGFRGVSFGSMALLRETLQQAYLNAQQAALEATPEATAEATTIEPTSEATVEATSEATVEATPEATAPPTS